MMNKEDIILITGAQGMVGSNLLKELKSQGYKNILTPTIEELNLINQKDVNDYFKNNKIDYVFHLAALVGGIQANMKNPDKFLYNNIMISFNVIESARKYKIKKLINLGSSCIYPAECEQPMKEEHLLSGKPEPTNEGYALAKISALKLCQYYNKKYDTIFTSIMPPNMYGKHDCFDLERAHVIPSLIKRIHVAKEYKEKTVKIWGSGEARREFLYVEDCVSCMLWFMNHTNRLNTFINVGVGYDVSIKELAYLIKNIVGYEGELTFDVTKPEGMKKKLMDSFKMKVLEWKHNHSLEEGLKKTYGWFLENEI